MINKLAIASVIMLLGCTTPSVPVKYKFPTPPAILMVQPAKLVTIDTPASTTSVKMFVDTVAKNYGTYHLTVEQLEALQNWIKDQQAIK